MRMFLSLNFGIDTTQSTASKVKDARNPPLPLKLPHVKSTFHLLVETVYFIVIFVAILLLGASPAL